MERMSMMMVLSLRHVSSKEKMLRQGTYSHSHLGLCLSSCRLAFVVCWIHSPPPCVVVKSLFSCTIPWRLSLSSYRVAPWTAGWLVLNVCRSYVQSILRNFWNLLSRQHCELTIKSGRKIGPFLRWHLSQYPFGWSNFWFISVLCVGTF